MQIFLSVILVLSLTGVGCASSTKSLSSQPQRNTASNPAAPSINSNLNTMCRGWSGNDPHTQEICDARDTMLRHLEATADLAGFICNDSSIENQFRQYTCASQRELGIDFTLAQAGLELSCSDRSASEGSRQKVCLVNQYLKSKIKLLYNSLNTMCRGWSGNDPHTDEVCKARDQLTSIATH